MANYREDILDIELENGNMHRNFMRHTIGSGDAMANKFGVRVFRNGNPEQLSGACKGYFIRADGATIPINGSINGNVAFVTLTDTCYEVEGVFALAIKVVNGGEKVTLRIVDGMVSRTSTDITADPGELIINVEELIMEIDAAVASIPADYADLSNAWNYHVPNPRNFIDPGYFEFNKTWGEIVGISSAFNFADETGSACCRIMIPVRQGDKLYVGQGAYDEENESQALFATFFWDTNLKFIKRVNYTNEMTVTDDGYASVMCYAVTDRYDITRRKYYANINRFYGYDDSAITESMQKQTEGYAPIQMTIQKGYYDDGVFFSNNDYQTAMIPVTPGEEYKVSCFLLGESLLPCAYFYNSNMEVIGNTGGITEDTQFINEAVKIPANCAYMNVHNYAYGPTDGPALYGLQVVKKSYGTISKPLAGKQIVVFGDSITYVPARWRKQFFDITGAVQAVCLSYPGAHLANYQSTVLDGNFNTDADGNIHNVVCNQVYYFLQHKDTDYADIEPDIFIIAAGTNDGGGASDYAESTDINVYNDNTQYTGSWYDEDTVDMTKFDGAMRWIHTKLKKAYPNAKIVFCSPIQKTVDYDYDILNVVVAKEKKMERVAGKLADSLVKAGTQSGITGEFDSAYAEGLYFVDGLHPNEYGGKVLGTFYANEITRLFTTGRIYE